jgi:uncharacterized membrane protein (DUF4010 family)
VPDWSLLGILVAALGGAAVGVERQRTGHASGANAHLGGVRTFTLLGGTSGLAGWLASVGLPTFGGILAAGTVTLVIAGYVAASRRDVDATTEAAGLVVIAAGILAGWGRLELASGIVAITTLLLVEKSGLHAAVARIPDEELRAAARFGVMAVVVLPLLPAGPYGPLGGIRPQQLWLMVLFFSGLSFAGFVARRAIGAQHGYPLAGLLGGLISSTNVTLTFSRLSRHSPALGRALAVGAIGACVMLLPRVLVATIVLNMAVASALWPYLVAAFVAGAISLLVAFRRSQDAAEPSPPGPANPLQLWPSLQMALIFQVVLYGVYLMRGWFGTAGVLASGAVVGLTDMDALTVSMAESATRGVDATLAARAIVVGIISNSVVKLALTLALGDASFRRLAGLVMAAMLVALGVSFAVL